MLSHIRVKSIFVTYGKLDTLLSVLLGYMLSNRLASSKPFKKQANIKKDKHQKW